MSEARTSKFPNRVAVLALAVCALFVAGITWLTAGAAAGDTLQVEKSDSPDPVKRGEILTYTISVENTSGSAVNAVRIEDKLPNSVAFVSASPGCNRQGRTVTCTIGPLAAGETETVTIRVRPQKVRTIENLARGFIANTLQDSDTERTKVTAPLTCAGRAPTIVGTPGDDEIVGTPGRDVIVTFGGGDTVDGLGGKDRICGGPGGDVLQGGGDADIVKGGKGPDVVKGGHGDDKVTGANGRDKVRGGADDDTVKGGKKNDRLRGGSGDDLLNGGSGDDRCNGGPGNNTLLKCG